MELSNPDRFRDEFRLTSDLIKAMQDVEYALQAMADLIYANQGSPQTKMPEVEDPPQLTELREYSILTEAENILNNEDPYMEINRLDKALLRQYIEAFRNQDWKRAHDLLLHGVVKRPYSHVSNDLAEARRWIAEAKGLLA